MRDKKIYLAAVIVGAGITGAFWFANEKTDTAAREPSSVTAAEVAAGALPSVATPGDRAPASAPAAAAAGKPLDRPLDDAEKQAVDRLANLLLAAEKAKSSKELARELKRAGLQPTIARDENAYTGRLDIVRTKDALPGTRYFHAQVFEGSEAADNAFTQHVSFQVRPGTDSMDVALAAIRDTHRDLGNPEINQPDYVLWRTKDGRVVSAKRMTSEDLQGNLFNAQDPVQDVGTIWVVSEDDPEDEQEHAHAHGA